MLLNSLVNSIITYAVVKVVCLFEHKRQNSQQVYEQNKKYL